MTAIVARRTARVLELRSQGFSYNQIAEVISQDFDNERYTAYMAYSDCEKAMKNIQFENTNNLQKLRNLELHRYDDYLTKIYPQIEGGSLEAVSTALKISRERNKMLGLYAPIQVQVQQIVRERVERQFEIFFETVLSDSDIPQSVKNKILGITEEIVESVEIV